MLPFQPHPEAQRLNQHIVYEVPETPPLPWQRRALTITLAAAIILAGLGVAGYGVANGDMYMIGGGAGGVAVGLLVGGVVHWIQKNRWEKEHKTKIFDEILEEVEDQKQLREIGKIRKDFLEPRTREGRPTIDKEYLDQSLQIDEQTRIPLADGKWKVIKKTGPSQFEILAESRTYLGCVNQLGFDDEYKQTYLESEAYFFVEMVPGISTRIAVDAQNNLSIHEGFPTAEQERHQLTDYIQILETRIESFHIEENRVALILKPDDI